MIDLLGINDDVTGKTKMQKINIIRKEVDSKMESDEKVARTCLEQLLAFVKGTVQKSIFLSVSVRQSVPKVYNLCGVTRRPLLFSPLFLEQTEETGPKTAAGVMSGQMGAQGKLKKEQV